MANPSYVSAVGSAGAATYALDVGTGANRLIIVITRENGDAVTYAGVAMTLIATLVLTGAASSTVTPMRVFALANPTSGSNNVAVSNSMVSSCAIALQDCKQSVVGMTVASSESAAAATSHTQNITTPSNNCLVVTAAAAYFFGVAPTAGAGNTFRANANALAIPAVFSSSTNVTPAGVFGSIVNQSSAGDKIGLIAIAVEAPSSGGAGAGKGSTGGKKGGGGAKTLIVPGGASILNFGNAGLDIG